MAITRVQSKSVGTGASLVGSQTLTFNSTPTAGNVIVLAIGCGNSAMVITATNIQFMFNNQSGSTQTNAILAFGRVFSSPGSTITVTWPQTTIAGAIVGAEYSGAGLLRIDKTTGATANSASPASGATSTTNTATELWVGAICARGTNANTMSSPTNSFVIVDQNNSTIGTTNSDRSAGLLERIVSSTGTANAGCTITSNIWCAVVMTMEETPSSGGSGGSRARMETR